MKHRNDINFRIKSLYDKRSTTDLFTLNKKQKKQGQKDFIPLKIIPLNSVDLNQTKKPKKRSNSSILGQRQAKNASLPKIKLPSLDSKKRKQNKQQVYTKTQKIKDQYNYGNKNKCLSLKNHDLRNLQQAVKDYSMLRFDKSKLEKYLGIYEISQSDITYEQYVEAWKTNTFTTCTPRWKQSNRIVIIDTVQNKFRQFSYKIIDDTIQINQSLVIQYLGTFFVMKKTRQLNYQSLYACLLYNNDNLKSSFFWFNKPLQGYLNFLILQQVAKKVQFLLKPNLQCIETINKYIYLYNTWGCMSYFKIVCLEKIILQLRQEIEELAKKPPQIKITPFYYRNIKEPKIFHLPLDDKQIQNQFILLRNTNEILYR